MYTRFLALAVFCVGSMRGGMIAISPSSLSVSSQQTFSLAVTANSISDLYAYQFDLHFDATLVQVISVTEGAFLPGGGATLFFPGTIDNVGGYLTNIADSLETAISGVTGSGTLADVSFQAIGAGTSPVNVQNLFLLDANLSGIGAGITNGGVTVVATPEPGGLVLLLGAAILVMLRMRVLRGVESRSRFRVTLCRPVAR